VGSANSPRAEKWIDKINFKKTEVYKIDSEVDCFTLPAGLPTGQTLCQKETFPSVGMQ